jgi:RecA/RadA recombinase
MLDKMQLIMPTATALHSYNLLKLPIGIFIDLTNAKEDSTVHDRFSSAKQLRQDIQQKLKQNSTLGPSSKRRRRWTSAQNHPARYNSLEDDTDRNLHAHSITTVGAFLQQSPYSLVFILDPLLSLSECQKLYQRICTHCSPHPRTAWMGIRDANGAMRLSTGWGTLDRALRGGLRTGTMTELVGAAGTAKTQLALQIAITSATALSSHRHTDENDVVALTSNSGGGTIWIDTEQKVSLLRLQEIAMARLSNPNDVKSTLENVTVHSPSNMTEFLRIMDCTLEAEIQSRNAAALRAVDEEPSRPLPVRLIVIDSIAAPMRREEGSNAAQQTTTLLRIAQQLKRIAHQYQLAILIINQVTSASQTTNWGNPKENAIMATTSRAALGTAWHHCVTTRIELEQFPDDHRRQARVAKSVFVEPSPVPIPFQVTNQGLVDLPK